MAPTDPTPRDTTARPVASAAADSATDPAGQAGQASDGSSRRRGLGSAGVLAGLATFAAGLALIPGFTRHGLWSTGEIAVLQRSQAALGAALGGLERSPVLPDALRTQALALTGEPAAIRLPGALASALLVGLAVLLARRLGAPPRFALLAGGFALAAPLLQSQARLALGNPIGELTATAAALLGAAAVHQPRRGPALGLALATLLTLALGLASAGLLVGVLLPLIAIAIAWPRRHVHKDMSESSADMSGRTGSTDLSPRPAVPLLPRWLAAALATAILGVLALIVYLSYHQGNGWIAALAAARDLPLAERPHTRPFTATFEQFSDQIFPWLPLLVVGLLNPGRACWPALWLLAGLVIVSGWSLRYGPQSVPLIVPAAVVCAAAVEHLLSPRTGTAARRLGLLFALAGGLILAKDARRTPSHVGAVLVHGKGEHTYPDRELAAGDLLASLARLGALAVLLAVLTRRPPPRTTGAGSPLQRLQLRLPEWLPVAIVLAALTAQALRYGHGLLPRTSELLSLHRPLTRFAAWQDAGALTGPLAVHRISDPGVDLYGPPPAQRTAVPGREGVVTWLKSQQAVAALVRTSELAPLFQQARAQAWPLHVLDASNRDVVLVGNTVPPGAVDENPILRVLHDAPPALAHETLVRFEDYIEVIGWQWQEPIVRGRETTLELALRVLKPLPSGSKVYVRLQQGKLSRINPMPHELAEGLYPPQHWRAGDYILHRFTVAVPMLEILPGAHEVVVGLRRTESSNYKISQPEAEPNPLGVLFRGAAKEFAVVGEVQVW